MSESELHKGHRNRTREKIINNGIDSLLEHELVELLLFYPLPRINTNEIAHHLMNMFGNVNNILNASQEELIKINNIGRATALFFNIIRDICNDYKKFSQTTERPVPIENLSEYMKNALDGSSVGTCIAIDVNCNTETTKHIYFCEKDFTNGSSDFKRTAEFFLKNNCTQIIIGTNHTDITIPNGLDYRMSELYKKKFSGFGISLVNFVMCCKENVFMQNHNYY